MNWRTHFQAISRAPATVDFGGFIEDCQFQGDGLSTFAPDATKKFAIPAVVGVVAGVVAKTAGLVGAGPILIGTLGALGTFFAFQSMENRGESKDLGTVPPPIVLVTPPQVAFPPRVAPRPFLGPVQQMPAAVSGKPWRVTAALSRDGAILSVADVQNALNELGFATPYLIVDGSAGGIGSKTTVAVKRAQAKYGLPQTGSTAQTDLKLRLQGGMADKAGFAKATAAADALAKEMADKGLV
jgi:hypothetical protein